MEKNIKIHINSVAMQESYWIHASFHKFLTRHTKKRAEQIQCLRDDFKTQTPVDLQFRPVPGIYHCLEQWKPARTERNRRPTGGWVLKPSLSKMFRSDLFPVVDFLTLTHSHHAVYTASCNKLCCCIAQQNSLPLIRSLTHKENCSQNIIVGSCMAWVQKLLRK